MTLAVLAAQLAEGPPAYVQRGDAVEARYRVYKERLERFYAALSARVRAEAPDLLPTLGARPNPVPHGYQILPRLVADLPVPSEAPRARSLRYSWPWSGEMIERDMKKIDAVAAELDGVARVKRTRRRSAFERMLSEYRPLPESARIIEAHIQYNRLWQRAIARDPAGYDRQTALHDAVVERQSIVDALDARDEAAFRRAVAGIVGIDPGGARDVLEGELRAREKALAEKIHAATDDIVPPPFLRGEHPAPHLWILKVPFYTDIDDDAFLRAWQRGVERVWQVRDGEDEFRVEIVLTHVSAERLYERVPPRKGEVIDLQAHIARFPKDGAVLTTGANLTHVTAGRCVALGPQDIAPHVLAHELGHILGFRDLYFRGYRDLDADGYEVMEVIAEPADIMGAPGVGPVLRHHFDGLMRQGAWPLAEASGNFPQ